MLEPPSIFGYCYCILLNTCQIAAMLVYNQIHNNFKQNKKQLAVLIDPDKVTKNDVIALAEFGQKLGLDYFFVGGSLVTNGNLPKCIALIKSHCSIPVVLFPGNVLQIDQHADAMLLLSLVSGRNPELLIGNHVLAAPIIKEKKLATISCGYMLIESGSTTTALYISNTQPIPQSKNDIAACTALAATMLGMKLIYLDAGSGALNPVPAAMIAAVKTEVDVPVIVGGGIRTVQQAEAALSAGADFIVVGNAIESDIGFLKELVSVVKKNYT